MSGKSVSQQFACLRTKIEQQLNEFEKDLQMRRPPFFNPLQQDKNKGPQKQIEFNESLLTRMFEVPDFYTLYNMAIASFIILTVSLVFNSYCQRGEIVDTHTLADIFRGWHQLPLYWGVLLCLLLTVIPLTKFALFTSNKLFIPIYLCHIYAIVRIAIYFTKSHPDFGFGSSFIIMSEAVRMIMKSHSYFRSKILYLTDNEYKNYPVNGIRVQMNDTKKTDNNDMDKQEKNNLKIHYIMFKNESYRIQFSKLIYFLFCPTLMYRQNYPLAASRSPIKILNNFINFLGCIYYSLVLFKICCKPVFDEMNELNARSLVMMVINLMLPSVGFLILGFFGFLHCWLNMWAQLLRFPDRTFYLDWWNSVQFGSYYRKWNIVVHDWLYYYLYLDSCRFLTFFRKHRWAARLFTFVISALMHELIVDVSIGYFYPILFLLFAGPGILFVQSTTIKKNSVNLIFWLEMYIGTSIMFSFYLLESFARGKITDTFIQERWGSLAFIVPRTIYLA